MKARDAVQSMARALLALCVCMIVLPSFAWDSYVFDLPSNEKESAWRDALAEHLHGQTEVVIDGGRIDVLTDQLAIEVDFQHKWHEGLGQALHYADATGKQGAVALISYSQGPDNMREKSRTRFEMVEKLYDKSDIKLIVLFPSRPRELETGGEDDDGSQVTAPKFRYWLNTRTGVRHNSDCQHYRNTEEGYDCGPKEGKACSICGG